MSSKDPKNTQPAGNPAKPALGKVNNAIKDGMRGLGRFGVAGLDAIKFIRKKALRDPLPEPPSPRWLPTIRLMGRQELSPEDNQSSEDEPTGISTTGSDVISLDEETSGEEDWELCDRQEHAPAARKPTDVKQPAVTKSTESKNDDGFAVVDMNQLYEGGAENFRTEPSTLKDGKARRSGN
jgi:hypothetical protein